MKVNIRQYLAVFLALCAISCTKPEEQASGLNLEFMPETATYQKGACFVHVTANGCWTLSITDNDGATLSWARFVTVSGKGATATGTGEADVVIEYDANEGEDVRNAVVLLESGRKRLDKYFSQNGKVDPVVGVPGWMELPEQQESLPFHCHRFNYDGRTYRNYSFGWDASSRLSQWVAYPLCSFYSNKRVERTEAWDFDTSVPQSQQANLKNGSYSGQYDRGHQLPSADRLVCRDANVQTFYSTNMTPQRASLNQGLWQKIESSVTSWAGNGKSDTLYVVTGCVMTPPSGSTNDRSGNICPLPYAYFKGVLRYNRASTQGWAGYTAIGIWVEHFKTYSSTMLSKEMVMSLADLEKKVGYKLFVNLEDVVGKDAATAIKSQNPTDVKFWGL